MHSIKKVISIYHATVVACKLFVCVRVCVNVGVDANKIWIVFFSWIRGTDDKGVARLYTFTFKQPCNRRTAIALAASAVLNTEPWQHKYKRACSLLCLLSRPLMKKWNTCLYTRTLTIWQLTCRIFTDWLLPLPATGAFQSVKHTYIHDRLLTFDSVCAQHQIRCEWGNVDCLKSMDTNQKWIGSG